MAFKEVKRTIKYPQGLSQRYKDLDALERMLDGTLYDDLKYSFDEESDGADQYIPLRERRPSVQFSIPNIVVDQTAALLFSSEQFPALHITVDGDAEGEIAKALEDELQKVIAACGLDTVMLDVYRAGNVGSCAVVIRSLDDNLPYIEVVPGKDCKPVFEKRNPRKLQSLQQVYPVLGADLIDDGYTDIDPDGDYFRRIDFDAHAETHYYPLKAEDFALLNKPRTDGKPPIKWKEEQSYPHRFGQINVVWVKNLSGGNAVDGPCTYSMITDTQVEIDYLLSQAGRGLKYSADPMLAINRGELSSAGGGIKPLGDEMGDMFAQSDTEGQPIKSPNNYVVLGLKGDAKLLEITGAGLSQMLEHVRRLREYAMETIGGIKSDSENTKGAQSGRALEILNNNLLLLVKRQRIAYGNYALLPLLKLICVGINRGEFIIPEVSADIPLDVPIALVWPKDRKPDGNELNNFAQAYQSLAGGSPTMPVPILPQPLLAKQAAQMLGIPESANLEIPIEQQPVNSAEAVKDTNNVN